MAYKVNYGLERAERNRAKQAKKEAKQRDRKATAESETPGREDNGESSPAPAEPPSVKPAESGQG